MKTRGLFFLLTVIMFLGDPAAYAAPRQVAPGEAIFGRRPGRTPGANQLFPSLAANSVSSSEQIGIDTLLVKDHQIAAAHPHEAVAYDPAHDPCPQLLSSLPASQRNMYYCEPNYILHADRVPDDPHYARYQSRFYEAIYAPAAWDTVTGCRDVKVAVIDTGIDYTHPDLTGNISSDPGYDFFNNDPDPMDDNSHGTFCAGTIGAAGNNALGVTGVNWEADIIGLKFLSARGSGRTSDAIRAIDFGIEQGARIMSASWGGPGSSEGLQAAIERARQAGILFVAAAGNEGVNADINPSYPAAYPGDNILSVAAVDADGELAWFSNYGAATVDLAAPGVNIVSTVPGGYSDMSGTSMATPLVAGAAALALCRNPDLTFAQLKALIMHTVTPLPDLAGKTVSGGMLNVQRAVENAFDPPEAPVQPEPVSGSLRVYDRMTSSSILRPGRRFEVHYQLSAPLRGGTGIFIKLDGRTCPRRRRINSTSTSVSLRGKLAASVPGTFLTMTLKSADSGEKLASVRNRIKQLRRSGRSVSRRSTISAEQLKEACGSLIRSLRVL